MELHILYSFIFPFHNVLLYYTLINIFCQASNVEKVGGG